MFLKNSILMFSTKPVCSYDYIPQPIDSGGMENKEGYKYGFLKRTPIFPEIMAIVDKKKNATLKEWAEECNRRNRKFPIGVRRRGSNVFFDAIQVGPKYILPSKKEMEQRLREKGYELAIKNHCVTSEMIREVTYEIVRRKFEELTGLDGVEIGRTLCCVIHEDKRGYAILVPNWAHKEWKHTGYASMMRDKINAHKKKVTKQDEILEQKEGSSINRKTLAIIVGVLLFIILLLLLLRQCGKSNKIFDKNIENTIKSQSSHNGQLSQQTEHFDWSKAIIINQSPNKMEPITIANNLSKTIEDAVATAEKDKTDTLYIPTLSAKFDFDSSIMGEVPEELVKEIVAIYKKTSQKQHINIGGYACNIGSNAVNDIVSNSRAQALKEALIASGVDESKIDIHSYGKRRNRNFLVRNNAEYRRVLISFK